MPRKRRRKQRERQVFDPLSRVMIDWVAREAARRGWTDKQLAENAGLPHSTISGMIAGKRGVNGDHWVKFVTVFGLDLRRSLNKLGDYMDDVAAGVVDELSSEAEESAYEDDGKYARKRSRVEISDKQPTSRPLR